MSLTPEQWRELDELRDRYGETCDADDCDCKYVRDRFVAALLENHGTLIDAARPKCPTCRGQHTWFRECTMCGDSTWDHECDDERRHCQQCLDHPGWAA